MYSYIGKSFYLRSVKRINNLKETFWQRKLDTIYLLGLNEKEHNLF